MWFNEYPYRNLTDLNLDFLYKSIKELRYQLENFININTIKYADPIQWNITKQYEANTVVIDANDGTAYLSTNPVPKGVTITNTDYWTPIFTLNLLSANQNITLRDDDSNVLATFASVEGDWLIWNNTLYKVTQTINVNEAYVVGYNLTRYSVEMFISDYITEVKTIIGDLSDLDTTNQDDIVSAINEVLADIGDLLTLTTSDKTSIVNAINEVNAKVDTISVTEWINVKDYGATGDGVTDDTAAINLAIAEVNNRSRSALYFPSGRYLISTLTPITTQCDIFGNGGSSVLLLASGHGTIFDLSAFYRGQLHDLAFIEDVPPAVNNDPVVVLSTGNYGHIYNITITNVKNFLKIGGDDPTDPGYMTTIDNIFGIVTGNFINLTGCRNVTYIHNVSINSEAEHANTVAIAINDIRGLDTLVISDSIFQRFYYGFAINQNNTSITTSNIWLDNVVFDAIYTRGIVANVKGKLYRVFINNSWVSLINGSSYEAILIQPAEVGAQSNTIYIENCNVPYCYYYSIHILTCGGFKISGCHLPSFVTHAVVLSNVSKGIIANNIFGNDGSNTPAPSGDSVNGVNMSDTVLIGNFADGFALSGSNWTNCRVIGNIGWVDNP